MNSFNSLLSTKPNQIVKQPIHSKILPPPPKHYLSKQHPLFNQNRKNDILKNKHSLLSRHASSPPLLTTNYNSYTMIIKDIEQKIFKESQLTLDKRKHYNKAITRLQLLITQSKITKNSRMEFIFSNVLLSVYQKYRESFGETSDSFSRRDMLVLLIDTERLKKEVDEKWTGSDGRENLDGITKELLEEVMSNSDETDCHSLLLGDGESILIDESDLLRRSRTLPSDFKNNSDIQTFRPDLIYPKQSSVIPIRYTRLEKLPEIEDNNISSKSLTKSKKFSYFDCLTGFCRKKRRKKANITEVDSTPVTNVNQFIT